MSIIPLTKFGLLNSATIISVSNIQQNGIRPAFKCYLHTDIQMWKDLLTSRLILRRRHIKSSNLTLRLLMSYIYGAHILNVSRSHTTTHHSR